MNFQYQGQHGGTILNPTAINSGRPVLTATFFPYTELMAAPPVLQQYNNIATDMRLRAPCSPATHHFPMHSMNLFQHLSPHYIDQQVEAEMKRLKTEFAHNEELYVEEMLSKNPIAVESRTVASVPPTTPNASNPLQNVDLIEDALDYSKGTEESAVRQKQRSDACRRSRINNKIKKAKTKHRHQFMSNKLVHTANVLEYWKKVMSDTENQLIKQGFSPLQLADLRDKFQIKIMPMQQ